MTFLVGNTSVLATSPFEVAFLTTLTITIPFSGMVTSVISPLKYPSGKAGVTLSPGLPVISLVPITFPSLSL